MRFWLSFLTLFLTASGFSQTCEVTGIVVNKANKPLDFILVKCKKANPTSTRTNPSGEYKLTVSQGDTIMLIFDQIGSSKEVNLVILKGETSKQIGKVVLQFQEQDSVEVTQKRFDPFELPTKSFGDLQKIPMGGVEKFLVYTTAAVSNNELTSNYNVRGGNYDENLV